MSKYNAILCFLLKGIKFLFLLAVKLAKKLQKQ